MSKSEGNVPTRWGSGSTALPPGPADKRTTGLRNPNRARCAQADRKEFPDGIPA